MYELIIFNYNFSNETDRDTAFYTHWNRVTNQVHLTPIVLG